jgi:hypothetical protein
MILHDLLADTPLGVGDPQSCSRLRLAEQHHPRPSCKPSSHNDTRYPSMRTSVNASASAPHLIQVERDTGASLSINATLSEITYPRGPNTWCSTSAGIDNSIGQAHLATAANQKACIHQHHAFSIHIKVSYTRSLEQLGRSFSLNLTSTFTRLAGHLSHISMTHQIACY